MTTFEICLIVVLVGNFTFAFVLAFAGLKLLKQLVDKPCYSYSSSFDYLDSDELNRLLSVSLEILEDKLDMVNEKNNLYNRFGRS